MRIISLEEKKKISLDILIEVDLFCKKNKIQYYLAYGSLLGAIRHNGFIPWDDDIDLIMFPDDYLKFIHLFNDNNSNESLYCVSYENGDLSLPYAKVFNNKTRLEAANRQDSDDLRVGIDIFPYSIISYNSDECKKVGKKGRLLLKMNRYKLYNNLKEVHDNGYSFFKMLFYIFVKMHTKKAIHRKTIRFKRKFYNRDSGLCKYLFDSKYTKLFDRKWFKETIDVSFEGHIFPAPKEYDAYLREYYGDYMRLPPEDERIPHIAESAFWID